jgi:hypothetical protein
MVAREREEAMDYQGSQGGPGLWARAEGLEGPGRLATMGRPVKVGGPELAAARGLRGDLATADDRGRRDLLDCLDGTDCRGRTGSREGEASEGSQGGLVRSPFQATQAYPAHLARMPNTVPGTINATLI